MCPAEGDLPQEVNLTGSPGPREAQHRGLRWGRAGDGEVAQGGRGLGRGAGGQGRGAGEGGGGDRGELRGGDLGPRGGWLQERQDQAAVTGTGLQDRVKSKDGAVRGIFNTEQGVLAAVTCTKEKEQSGSSTHGGKGH